MYLHRDTLLPQGRRQAMNYTQRSEALEECERLKKMDGRERDARTVECPCDFFPGCYVCQGNGVTFELFYLFCNHVVADDDRDELDCLEFDCAEREKVRAIQAERDLLSIPETFIEEEMEETINA
jgi:hypothetical protein